ncbi:MAG: hypothetical protein WC788_08480 [Candidatus Paceibacterota bacterium]
MAEKNYRARSVLEKEKQSESVIKNIISLIRKGNKADAEKMLMTEMAKESVSTHIYRRKMQVILGFICLGKGDPEGAEKYFLKALKRRTAYGKERIENKISLVSYSGLAICCSRKYISEGDRAKKDIIKIRAEVYSELMTQYIEVAENAETKELIRHIHASISLLQDLRGPNKSRKIKDLESIDIIELIEIIAD